MNCHGGPPRSLPPRRRHRMRTSRPALSPVRRPAPNCRPGPGRPLPEARAPPAHNARARFAAARVRARGGGRAVRCGAGRLRNGSCMSFLPRPFPPRSRPPGRGADPVSRVSPARPCARPGGRCAPARQGRRRPHGCRFLLPHHSIFFYQSSIDGNYFFIAERTASFDRGAGTPAGGGCATALLHICNRVRKSTSGGLRPGIGEVGWLRRPIPGGY